MMTTAKKITSRFKQDVKVTEKIPYSHFIDESTIETKNGNLLQIIEVVGLHAETLDNEWINIEKNIRNSLWMMLTDSTLSFSFHTVRKRFTDSLSPHYKNDFLNELNNAWQKTLSKKDFYINTHYITIMKKPPVGRISRLTDIVKSLSATFLLEERERFREASLASLNKAAQHIITTLKKYGAIKLNNQMVKNSIESPSLTFLFYLINGQEKVIVAPHADIAMALPASRLFFDETTGTMAIVDAMRNTTYAAILSIKQYTHLTHAGLLDQLQDVKAELILSHIFSPIEKAAIREKIKEEKRNADQSDDGMTNSSQQIDAALNAMGSGEASQGIHQFSILCKAKSTEQLNQYIAEIDAKLAEVNVLALREDTGIQPAFFAMLPGNHAYITRPALISSQNMASLFSMHNVATGKREGNFWGEAVTILETISGAPFYFNFHVLDVANTFMIGPMGSGKTLLQAFLLSQSMKAGGRLIVFDKGRGFDIAIRAMNGSYSYMTPGKRTGFAPFQMDDTPNNRAFLVDLLRMMAVMSGVNVTSETLQHFSQVVEGAYHLPPEKRILRNIVPMLGMKKTGSLRSYFESWVNGGQYAWIFDNEIDELSLNHDVIGFEMEQILENPIISPLIYYYLFHRVEQLLDGTPTRIVAAEAWRALDDETFRKKIKEWSSTPRKNNVFLVLDTQAPSDIAKSPIGSKIIQESKTQIYFANPAANEAEYIGQFGLTKKEFSIVKALNPSSRFFLLKQVDTSVVVRADLSEMKEHVAVLSSTKRTQVLLDKLIDAHGKLPEQFLPPFYRAVQIGEITTL